jgi:hypothetical protein
MRQAFDYIIETFTMLGCARAAAELARMGHYKEAGRLMTEFDRIKAERQHRKELKNGAYSVL